MQSRRLRPEMVLARPVRPNGNQGERKQAMVACMIEPVNELGCVAIDGGYEGFHSCFLHGKLLV